jgi:hypothetical protein
MPTAPFVLLRENEQRVRDALCAGKVDAVWESRRNCFDEMVGFLAATGVFDLFGSFSITRERAGIPDDLMLRVLMTSALLRCHSIREIPRVLFTDPGVLRFLGFTIRQLEEGFNQRGGSEKQLPFSQETLYDLWPRLTLESIEDVRAAYARSLLEKGLVRGTSYVIDGSSLICGKRRKGFLPLLNIRGGRELVVDYRILEYSRDLHDSELTAGKAMVRDALAAGVRIEQLTVDRFYVDGHWMRELVEQGVDLMVRVREDMQIFADMQGHGTAKDAPWQERVVKRKVGGNNMRQRIRLLLIGQLETWESYGGPLTGLLIECTALDGDNTPEVMAIVSPREYRDPWLMWREWRRRWRVENTGFHELKEGYLLEKGVWGRCAQAIALSILLRVIAYNTCRLYASSHGRGWTIRGLRAMQREVFDAAGMFIIAEAAGEYAVLRAKEMLYLLGKPPLLQQAPPGWQDPQADEERGK